MGQTSSRTTSDDQGSTPPAETTINYEEPQTAAAVSPESLHDPPVTPRRNKRKSLLGIVKRRSLHASPSSINEGSNRGTPSTLASTSSPRSSLLLQDSERQQSTRRSTIRKSLLSLVKPRSSSALDESSDNAESSSSARNRSWRGSRRQSNRQSGLGLGFDVDQAQGAGPSAAAVVESSESIHEHPRCPPLSRSVSTRPPTPFPAPDSDESMHETSQNLGEWMGGDRRALDDDNANNGSTFEIPPQPSVAPPPVPDTEAQSSETPAQRSQFPPSGTLVLVQGVVHTTDVPRDSSGGGESSNLIPPDNTDTSAADSTLRPTLPTSSSASSSRTRNRLSALLQSPQSRSRSRPSSVVDRPENVVEPRNVSPPLDSATADHIGTPPFTNNTGPISSNSIDVLGTLLSVAAAATAASLLSGSAENILSRIARPATTDDPDPSFSPLSENGNSSNSDDLPRSRPPSPTPTAGLDRAERMRSAWGSFRERLGMDGNSAETEQRAGTSVPTIPERANTPTTPAASPTGLGEARGMMVSEMARAFNLGLGLNQSPATAPSTVPASTSGTDSPSNPAVDETTVPVDGVTPTTPAADSLPNLFPDLPAEGSFERFLIDLQIDLRIALTLDPSLGQDPDRRVSSSSSSRADPPSLPLAAAEQTNMQQRSEDHEDIDDHPPPLQALSDSEDEAETDGDARSDDNRRTAPRLSRANVNANTTPTTDDTTNPNNHSSAHGNINWWRSFQFPPIMAPRDDHAASDEVSNEQSASREASPSVQQPEGVAGSDTTANSNNDPNTSDSGGNTHLVYPIIVVGLQSVSAMSPSTTTNNPDTAADSAAHPHDARTSSAMAGQDPAGRGRRWQARAANALRNLRSNNTQRNSTENNTDESGTDAEGHDAGTGDSRTFLIYVIGGYYPPGHSMVTRGQNGGDRNTFGSFEALLELAELLGQVKPPTVTKADIEKSGLQIVKARDLARHEEEGTIKENCVERCLICLDEYVPEDDVRVLGCHHGFHKNCVDRWLETGRNSCPACRSKGVPMDDDEPVVAQPPPPASLPPMI